jgi:hypothetical protein
MINRKQKSKCVKFLYFISILSLLIGSTFNSSCEKSEKDIKPFISFLRGPLPTEITITKGTLLTLNVFAKSNSETKSKLVRLTVEHKYNDQIQKTVDSSFNVDMIDYSYDHSYNSDTGRIEVIFKVEDSLGQTNEARYIVNVYEPRPSINFVKSSGLIYNDTTLPANTNFRVRINASSNTLTKSRLYHFTVQSDFNHIVTYPISEIIDTEFYEKELTFRSSSEPGIEKLTFMIEAKDNAWSSIALNIKTE